jgi:dipeptidyl aminopeptidase/acylaminoacyl peptidase
MRLDRAFALCSFISFVIPSTLLAGEVQRDVAGHRLTEGIPAIPAELSERLRRYQNLRSAGFDGWTQDGCLLIDTRFAETTQAHRVCAPLGQREQLTFYAEPVANLVPAPSAGGRDGFVFSKDQGGDEFSQLYWFDLRTRATERLSDGGRSQNYAPVFSPDGARLAWSSTARNGSDTDVWVMDLATRTKKAVVAEGGAWGAMDFSPDGSKLLVYKQVSIAETYPGLVDLGSGKLTLFPVDGGRAAVGNFRFSADGRAVYYVSDEPVAGKVQEFRSLRYHEPASGKLELLSADIPWDIDDVQVARDGKHLAFVANADGMSALHVLSLPQRTPLALPGLPAGVIGAMGFSPDGRRLAISLNSARSPNDVYVIDLAEGSLTRWTRSETGGLDPERFVAPALVRYPSFDKVGGKARTIPAFYFRPAELPAGRKLPVVIRIHGGPESQALASFNASVQAWVDELGIAVLVPNVRGSSGYGKSYLALDNGARREDSVRDIGALLDWIAKQPELDARRVGVYGGSYGGYMSLAALTHYSQRLRAGVEMFGISHFGTFLASTESYRRDLRRAEYGDERDPAMRAVFERISPLNHAGDIGVPLFAAQGRNDPRVPYTETEQIVKAVRAKDRPVWYVLFDDEGHGFRKKANADYFEAATVLFWQRYLLDASR